MTTVLQNSSNGLYAQARRIFDYLDENIPIQVRDLKIETNSENAAINMACLKFKVRYFPPYRMTKK